MPRVGNHVDEGLPLGESVVTIDDVDFVPKALKFGATQNSLDPNDYQQQWKWVVIGQPDANGKQVKQFIRTGIDYGSGRATLTKLLNGVFRVQKLTPEQFERLDFLKMKGLPIIIGMAPNEKGDGTIFSYAKPHPQFPVTPEQFFEDATTTQFTAPQILPQTPTRPVQSPQAPGRVANPFGASASQQSADF